MHYLGLITQSGIYQDWDIFGRIFRDKENGPWQSGGQKRSEFLLRECFVTYIA